MKINLLEHWENLGAIATSADGAVLFTERETIDFGSVTTLWGPFSQAMIEISGKRVAAPATSCLIFDNVSVQDTFLLRDYGGDHVAEFGAVATIVQPGMSVFGHWLIDILIRLSYLELVEIDEPIHVLVPNNPHVTPLARRFVRILAKLDPRIVVEFVDATRVVRARKCFVLPVLRAGNAYPSQCRRHFDRVAKAAQRANHKPLSTAPTVFVSRSKWGDKRRLLSNRDEVEQLAIRRGMSVMTPESHEVESVICALNHSVVVMGERGSGVHFTAYSQSARSVISLISGQRSFTGMEFAQSGLCRMRGQRSIFVAGETVGAASDALSGALKPMDGEVFEAPLELLEQVLDVELA